MYHSLQQLHLTSDSAPKPRPPASQTRRPRRRRLPRHLLKGRRLALIAGLGATLALLASASAMATGTWGAHDAAAPVITTGTGNPVVYHTVQACCQTITLGDQSNPTHLGDTPPLNAGSYLVQYSVNATLGVNDSIVCAAAPVLNGNDGVFGTTGNGGNGNPYGTATAVDTITVTKGQTIGLTCNVAGPNPGTYVSSWSLTAMKIGTLHKQTL